MTLFRSASATITLKDPITDATLITLTTQLRGLPTSESLEYVDRQYARSGSVSSARKRSKGQLSIDKTPDGMALVRELKRWQEGVIYYPLTSDLKGKVYRHPYLEISLTDSGTTELIRAYGIRLASRSFDLPLSGPASDSISLDVLRGFDLTTTEAADQGEPFKALSIFRTGTATYTNSAGTITSAGDSAARFGVPVGSYSASKAGLVLEGAGANYFLNSGFESGTTGWTAYNGTASSTTSAGEFLYGSKGLRLVAGAVYTNARLYQQVDTFLLGQAISTYWHVKGIGVTVGKSFTLKVFGENGGVYTLLTSTTVVLTADFQQIKLDGVTVASSDGTIYVEGELLGVTPGSGEYCVIDVCQLEKNPFSTSYIENSSTTALSYGTRNADYSALTSLQNYLTYSEDFSQSATWIDGGTSSAQPTSAGLWTISNTDNTLYQAVTPSTTASLDWTFTVGLKSGTLSGSVQIQIEDQAGNLIGSAVTVATTSLSSTTTNFTVTATAAADDTGLRAKIKGNSGTGNITIVNARLEQSDTPGVYCKTTDTALPKPVDGVEWPDWIDQNGKFSFSFVIPTGANVAAGTIILGKVGDIVITQLASTITLSRASNGGTRTVTITKNAADNAVHTCTAEWGDYTTSGTRAMPLILTVDATTATIDAAATYGDTSWAVSDRLYLSGGSAFVTLQDFTPQARAVPAGSIAA